MAGTFTSGENTADVRAERKINGKGIGVFIAILIFFLLLFVIWTAFFMARPETGNPSQPTTTESDRRAQP